MFRWVLGLFAAVWLVAAPAYGQGDSQKTAARELANAAFEKFSAGQFADALGRFEAAERIYHAPPHVLFIARCHAKLGHLLEARDRYVALLNEDMPVAAPREFRQAKKSATAELTALLARIPTVQIEVAGGPAEGVEVTVDDKPAGDISQPVAVSVGQHRIAARAQGYAESRQSVEVVEGARASVTLALVLAGDTPPAGGDRGTEPSGGGGSLVGPLVVLGVGAAGLVVGAVTGAMALGKSSDLADACPVRTGCPAEFQSIEDDARTLGTVSTIGFIAGGVGVAGGVTWLLLELMGGSDEAGDTEARLQPFAQGPVGGLRLSF